MNRRLSWFGILILAGASLVACSSPQGRSGDASQSSGETTLVGSVSEARSFSTVEQLANAAPVVVRATAQGDAKEVTADAQGLSGEKSTISTLVVSKSYKGNLKVGDSFELRQTGTRNGAPQEIVNPNVTYLLYLQKFEFSDHKDTGQWTPVSLAGIYEKGDGRYIQLRNVSEVSKGLPQSISEAGVDSTLK